MEIARNYAGFCGINAGLKSRSLVNLVGIWLIPFGFSFGFLGLRNQLCYSQAARRHFSCPEFSRNFLLKFWL